MYTSCLGLSMTWFEEELNIEQSISTKGKEFLYTLLRVSSLFAKFVDKYLIPYGLTEAQYKILELLSQNGRTGMTQVEISEILLVNRSNITGLVDRLEKAGFVNRSSDPKDRRINRIKLKEKAKKALKDLQQPYVTLMTDICKPLNKDEMKTLQFLFGKIEKQLNKHIQMTAAQKD